MTFARPDMLVWLWLVPLSAAMLLAAHRRRRDRLLAFCGAGPTSAGVRGGRVLVKALLVLSALAAIVVALAQPRWGFEWTDVKRRGTDLVVAVDVSRSMLASDVEPSRLERAKRKLSDLLAMLEGDLVGLVAFAGDAFVQCPLTEDYGAVRLFASYLEPSLIPVQGTDLGKAISAAMRALKEGGRGGSGESDEAGGASQAIILITDGEDNEGKGLEEAAKAKAAGIKIYTIALGSDAGAPIPEGGGGFKKDAQGNLVLTKPDEASLQKIALETGGLFVRSVASDADLAQIYRQGIRKSLTEKDVRETRHKLWYERYQWFVGLAMGLLTLEWLLRDVRLAMLLLVMLGAAPLGRARAGSEREAHAAYAKGDYANAAKGFLEAEVESPDAPDKAYNRAASQFKAKDYANAASGFAKAAETPGSPPKLAQRSRFNEGNAWVGANKLDEAIRAYEQALELDPNDVKAKENLEYVKKIKEQQEQQKNQDKKQQSQQNQDQQQSQQNQDQQQSQQNQDQQQSQQNQDQQQSQQNQDQQQGQQPDQQAQQGQKDQAQDRQQQAAHEQAAAGQAQQAGAQPMSKEEAEQVLRSAEDQIGRFLYAPKQTKSRQNPGKDW